MFVGMKKTVFGYKQHSIDQLNIFWVLFFKLPEIVSAAKRSYTSWLFCLLCERVPQFVGKPQST